MRQVPEDYPVNEPVFVVRAEDEDRGNNAELSYILETASQLQYGQIFRLHRSTGEVRNAIEMNDFDGGKSVGLCCAQTTDSRKGQ